MNIQETRKSDLFNIISWLGLLCTEERRIRQVREEGHNIYEPLDLTYDDVERVGYFNPHVAMPPKYKDHTELWFEDRYINPKSVQWVETINRLYAILDQQYDELVPVMCYYNPSILYRYSNIADNEDTEYAHVYTVNTKELRFSGIHNIEHAAYYISQDQVCIPETTWLDDHTIQFRAPYKHDIDFFLCANVASVVKMTKDTGAFVDNAYSNYCYHQIIVDHSSTYPIDARFYPCIRVDKDCTVRVLTDSYDTILSPETARLVNYPEFIDFIDPYNTDNEYLNHLQPVDDIITSDDTDEEIIEKFKKIASYCYRMWECYPIDTTMQNDYCICDNSKLSNKTFVLKPVELFNEKVEKICSTVPYEPFRDLIFYHGVIFSDYTVKSLKVNSDGILVENPYGTPTYLIDQSYDIDGFSIVKFNTAEDTSIMNIGEYIDVDKIIHLHYKLNRFYRNLLVIRQELLDSPEEDYVRVATEQPNTKDEYLWLELLVNAIPEMFHTDPITEINLYGLDPKNIPDDVKEGAYKLDLNPEGGPASYTDLLMTYFKLSKNKKKYLALQYGDGVDDPRIQVFHDLKVGQPSKDDKLNQVLIEDQKTHPTYTETEVNYGLVDQPTGEQNQGKQRGDLYFQVDHMEPKKNVPIDQISTGPNEPERDESTIWIDTDGKPVPSPGELPEGYYPKDYLDDTTDSMKIVNEIEDVENPEKSDYVIDANQDTFLPGQEGDSQIYDLINALNMDHIEDPQPGNDVLQGITDAIANNSFVDDIENPYVGQFAMDDIQFFDADTGEKISMAKIAAMSREQKIEIINKLITDDDEPTNAQKGDIWISYLSKMTESMLNTVVYQVLLTKNIQQLVDMKYGDLSIEGQELPTEGKKMEYGSIEIADGTTLVIDLGPQYLALDEIRKHNVEYIMSWPEPVDPEKGLVWLQMPAATLVDVIKDMISCHFIEIGEKVPRGHYDDSGYDTYGTIGLDYDAHGKDGLSELFQEKIDESLHPIHYGSHVDFDDLKEDDVWYEYLDEIDNKVAYADEYSMVIRVDERLILVNFNQKSDITAFAFDDILLNFHGKLGIRYLSIISDLINSGEIKLDDVNIFYKRLITFGDDFDPRLRRLYTGTSHVVSTAKIDTSDYAILYSSNIGRYRMDYSSPDTTRKEREAAYRMCIDLRGQNFSFLKNRMLLFVNGKYIPTNECEEETIGLIQLKNFHEIIATVDIFYNKKDQHLIDLKYCAYPYWQYEDDSTYIERPLKNYDTMQPIRLQDYTKKGYYDILLDEYIFNGRLLRILNYLEEHPEEAESFKYDLIRKFHAISDIDVSDLPDKEARIVITGNNHGEVPYTIQLES